MKTRFHEVYPGTEEYVKMQRFAESFQHTIAPCPGFKTVVFEREQRVFGYADVSYVPIGFPAFHPEVATPRAVHEIFQAWRAHGEISHGGGAIIAVPLDAERQTFPKAMIEGLGFRRMHRELYRMED